MDVPTKAEQHNIAKALLHEQDLQRFRQHEAYIQYYWDVLCRLNGKPRSAIVSIDRPLLASHSDVLFYVEKILEDATQTRNELMIKFPPANIQNKENAIQDLLRITFMLDCFSLRSYPDGFRMGDFVPSMWRDQERLADFIPRVFPSRTVSSPIRLSRLQRKLLKAWKLQKRHNIKFHLTNDLTEHLLYNSEDSSIKIFRHTGYLKAQIRHSVGQPLSIDFEESLKMGTLPPQLLLETLESIQHVLFPISLDPQSERLLEKFKKQGFDPKTSLMENRIRPLPENFAYEFWGNRLQRLLEIVDSPPFTDQAKAWFERRISERNALIIAMIGLLLTALFGFLGLLVAIAQLVYAIKQYEAALLALSSVPETVN